MKRLFEYFIDVFALPSIMCLIVIGFFFSANVFGCQAETTSLIYPDKQITRAQLLAEVDFLKATAMARIDDLDEKEEFRRNIAEFFALSLEQGSINISGIAALILTLFGGTTAGTIAGKKLAQRNTTN